MALVKWEKCGIWIMVLKKITTILPFVFPEWFPVCDEMP